MKRALLCVARIVLRALGELDPSLVWPPEPRAARMTYTHHEEGHHG